MKKHENTNSDLISYVVPYFFSAANRRAVFDFIPNSIEGIPDGMTIDATGKLWVACFGGSQV